MGTPEARGVLSHSNPSGDLVAVIERALDVLIERTLKQRFAQTKQPRPSRAADRKGTAAHNRLLAERDFGREFVAARRCPRARVERGADEALTPSGAPRIL